MVETNINPQPNNYEKKYAMLQWLNNNRRNLLAKYRNQYVAYNANGLIAHSENLPEILDLANASGEDYLIYLVPQKTASIQILSSKTITIG